MTPSQLEHLEETMTAIGEQFQDQAREAVRREHYGHDPNNIPQFEQKVDKKMWSMLYYLFELAGKNAP